MRNNQGTKKASPFRWMLRRYIFLMVAAVIIAFAAFPMQGMTRVMSVSWSLENMEPGEPIMPSTVNAYTRELTLSFVYSPLNLEMLCALFGGLGFAAALVLFRHLFSRKQGMLIAGLPMTRSRDFLLRCLVYGLWGLLPLALCMLIHPLVVWGNGLGEYFDTGVYLLRMVSVLLISLYGFAMGALCASAFGTFWSAGLGGMLLVGSVELVLDCWIWLAAMYLPTLYRFGAEKAMLRLSPAYSLYKFFYHPGELSLLPGLLAIAVLMFLAWLAYGRVKPENAGHTLNMKKLEPWILAWATVLGGTGGAVVLTLYLGREASLYIGLILGAAVAWVLAQMLLDQRIQLSLRRWKIPAAMACAMVLAMLGLRVDLPGYNTYAPRTSDLQAMRIYPEMGLEEVVLTEKGSLDAGLAWTGQMREEMLESRRKTPFQSDMGNVLITFEEKGGRTVTRQYPYPENQEAVLPALRVLAPEMERQRADKIKTSLGVNCYSSLSSFGIYGQEFAEAFGFSPDSVSLLRLDADKVRDALRQDLRARTLETLQQPNILNLSFSGMNPETGEYEYDYTSYHIKPADTHTLHLILGEDAEKWVDYANGGFARSGSVKVFLCEYTLDGEEEHLENYRMAESEEEAREWLTHITRCTDMKFTLPRDRTRQIRIYSMQNLRDMMNYGGPEIDLEDPEILKKLPEITDAGYSSYPYVKTGV